MGFSVLNVQWGWRVPCSEPGCSQHLTEWREGEDGYSSGPPSLPYHHGSRVQGWFFMSQRDPDRPGCRIYRAYCPDHAEAAFTWQDRLQVWKDARRAIGKQTHLGLLGRLQEWGARLLNIKVGQTVQGWTAENPRPTPPWQEAA
jgi:hypothetical protein